MKTATLTIPHYIGECDVTVTVRYTAGYPGYFGNPGNPPEPSEVEVTAIAYPPSGEKEPDGYTFDYYARQLEDDEKFLDKCDEIYRLEMADCFEDVGTDR